MTEAEARVIVAALQVVTGLAGLVAIIISR